MLKEIHKIEHYFQEILGITTKLTAWKASNRLPFFLRDVYRFFQAELLGMPCLLMVDQAEEAPSPSKVRKHMAQIELKWEGEVIYVREQVVSHQRKRLIEQKVPFLVPGNQMYLPMLGIDLREHFRKQRQTPLTLKPATQALVLQLLLYPDADLRTPVDFANRLGYTKMTMSRAFDELEVEQLCKVTKEGRERLLHLKGTRKELWQNALPLLRSPVKQRKCIQRGEAYQADIMAGLTALSKYSMLAAPRTPVRAVSLKEWKKSKSNENHAVAMSDDHDAIEVETWAYDPGIFSNENVVDRFSLFLSLRDSKDERIEAALKEMMEQIEW